MASTARARPAWSVACGRRPAICARPPRPRGRAAPPARASSSSPGAGDFDLSAYCEASITEVRSADTFGHVILLRLDDGLGSVLPVYIGEFECGALVREIAKRPGAGGGHSSPAAAAAAEHTAAPARRPGTHDLALHLVEAAGFRVAAVRITALVGNTYMARVHLSRRGGAAGGAAAGASPPDADVDARPSDAINLAVRAGAPIYVNREVAARMARPPPAAAGGSSGAGAAGGASGAPPSAAAAAAAAASPEAAALARACREELARFADPTMLAKLQLQVAVADERFDDARRLRDAIDRIIGSDRGLALAAALEAALDDGRADDARAALDELRALRAAAGGAGAGAGAAGGAGAGDAAA